MSSENTSELTWDDTNGAWTAYAKRWDELRQKHAKVEYEIAELAAEIRAEFPKGASGDYQFRRWCMDWLLIAPPTASMLLRAARAHRLFEKKDWYLFGGRLAVQYLASLPAAGRRRVVKACRDAVEARSGLPICYNTTKSISYSLGVVTDRTTGRPNRLLIEENLGILREFIIDLYKEHGTGLPDLPEHVEKAMTRTKLAEWRRQALPLEE